MNFFRPIVVGIDDRCDACGATGCLGVLFGPHPRPVICEGCFFEGASALDRWRKNVGVAAGLVKVPDASGKRGTIP